MSESNGTYSTSDFREAVYLRKSGVIFLKIEWPSKRALFVFKRPPDEILAAWARGEDGGVRAILDAADFCRSELHGRD
jgi:hypothetical protein